MRIRSLKIKNYRIHRDFAVEFDPSLTLIGGPNESGKSTLLEAAYNVLFMRYKRGGRDREGLISHFGGVPEVEMEFEACGSIWTLRKSFRGSAGSTATLRDASGSSWQGDEAEQKLFSLCSLPDDKAAADQWACLWIRQGDAWTPPFEFANRAHGRLAARLQSEIAESVLQSARDRAVAAAITGARSELLVDSGRPKAGGELAIAMEAERGAMERLEAATAEWAKLQAAADDFADAKVQIAAVEPNVATLKGQIDEVRAKILQAQALESRKREIVHALEPLDKQAGVLQKADREIRQLEADQTRAAEALGPLEEELKVALQRESDARDRRSRAQASAGEAAESTRKTRQVRQLADLCRDRWKIAAELVRLEKSAEEARELQEKLARIPKADAKSVAELARLEQDCTKAAAALNAISARVDILEAEAAVRIGERELGAGESLTFSTDMEIAWSGLRVRIVPGGGENLAAAGEKLRDAEARFRAAKDTAGVDSVEAARTALSERQMIEDRLKGLASAAKEFEGTRIQLREIDAEIETRRIGGLDLPVDSEAAARWLTEAAKEEEAAAEAEQTARQTAEVISGQCDAAVQSTRAVQERRDAALRLCESRRATLETLRKTHGQEVERTTKIAELAQSVQVGQAQIAEIDRQLGGMHAGALPGDEERLQRALRIQQEILVREGQRRVAAEALLRRDGATDPAEVLACARAAHERASNRRAAIEERAEALSLLERLFEAEQIALSKRFMKPLVDKVSGYLACIFGPGTSADLQATDAEFDELRLTRVGDPRSYGFGELSGGTQEQTAVAFRLAMAEVLCADHDGCLPVFLDDAFVNSDPERLSALQRMLDLAARRGLQVIVLTCTPAEYAPLGATTIRLQRPAYAGIEVTSQRSDAMPPIHGDGSDASKAERFLRILQEVPEGRLGNQTLRERLGWDEETYEAVKAELLATGAIQSGRGRGGSVVLAGRSEE